MNAPDPARHLLDSALAELQAAFDLFDRDQDGKLDVFELQSALRGLGQPMNVRQVHQLIASVGGSDGLLDFGGFCALVEPRPQGLDPDADLREAFQVLDADGDGTLSKAELRAALKSHDAEDATQEVDAIFAASGADMIDFETFRRLVGGE